MKYVTVVIDIYGRVYDLKIEHPSYDPNKTSSGWEKSIKVVNAFTCTEEELVRLKKKSKKND